MAQAQIFLLAVCLSMDAFAVALAAGASGRAQGRRAEFRISFHFGLFQFAMPILGWLLAYSVQGTVHAVDHWIACGLLWVVGLRMIFGHFNGGGQEGWVNDPSRGVSLIALSVATSIDALAVGFTLACLGEEIVWPSGLIGLTTASFSLAGVRIGSSLSSRFGRWVERIGGVVLMGMGVQIVISHLRAP